MRRAGARSFLALSLLAASLSSTACVLSTQLEIRRLEAVCACTRMACPESNPCCNACGHQGWQIQGASDVPLLGVEGLPTCEPDGCGECEFDLEARGVTGEQGFQVVDWKEVPRTKRLGRPVHQGP